MADAASDGVHVVKLVVPVRVEHVHLLHLVPVAPWGWRGARGWIWADAGVPGVRSSPRGGLGVWGSSIHSTGGSKRPNSKRHLPQ